MKLKRLAQLNKNEDPAWVAYYNWYAANHVDHRSSRCDKYTWAMIQNEFPRLQKYDGALP